jgi:hypothetical protein
MRRSTAVLLLSLSLFATVPSYGASIDRSFGSRIRSVIQRILSHIGSNGDSLSPPKP